MIGAGAVITQRLRRPATEKDRARGGDRAEQRARRARLDQQVLGSVALGDGDRRGEIGYHDQARGGQRLLEDRPARLAGHNFCDPRGDGSGQFGGSGHQQRLRTRVMLRLRQQIEGHESRVGALVGDHHHFRRPGRHIHRRAIRIGGAQLLGGRDPPVSGAKDLVDLRDTPGAIGQRRDGLRATHLEHRVHAAQARYDQHRRIGSAVATRRRAQHTLRATCDARGHRQHDRCRGQRRGAGRHIQTDGADGPDQLLATHSRLRLQAGFTR